MNLQSNIPQLMAKAGFSIDDALWFHCTASRMKTLCNANLFRYLRIQAALANSLRLN